MPATVGILACLLKTRLKFIYNMALSKEDREEITILIHTVVNGNIRRVEEKVDLLNSNINPILEAVMWVNTTKKVTVWVAGFIVSLASVIASYNIIK